MTTLLCAVGLTKFNSNHDEAGLFASETGGLRVLNGGRISVGNKVTIHYSDSIKTHGVVTGHTKHGDYEIASGNRTAGDPIIAKPEKVTEYQPPKRSASGSKAPRPTTPGGRIQHFLDQPHIKTVLLCCTESLSKADVNG